MRLVPILRLVRRDLRHQAGRLAAGSVGVVVAVAVAVFALGLGTELRSTVLGKVFPLDLLEVTPKTVELDLFAVRLGLGGDTLDPAVIDQLAALPGVRAVSPRIVATVPAIASGGRGLIGTDLTTELAVDGLDESILRDDLSGRSFADPGPSSDSRACRSDRDCSGGQYCTTPWSGGAPLCRSPIPAVVSRHLVELFNSSLRRSWSLPRVNPDALVGLTFDLRLGQSGIGLGTARRAVSDRVRLVGFSDRAIPLGVSLPAAYVQRVNRHFGGSDAPHGALVVLTSSEAAPAVMREIRRRGLEVRDRGAQRAATVLALLMIAAAALALAMLAVAAVGVAHAMSVMVVTRRREIGVLRAVGVGRAEIRLALLAEACLASLVSALCGVALAWLAGRGLDLAVTRVLPELPYRPDHLVTIRWWLGGGAAAAGAAVAAIGAWWPVRRATAADPAAVLRPRS
jgi:ABC-type lipoprotein release transport system permease subunit